jgi:hypothetical protein
MAIRTIKKLLQRRGARRRTVSSYVGIYDLETEEFIGHLTNRSSSGLMITGTKALEPSQTYHLGMQSGSFDSPGNLHTLKARCLWAKQETKDEFFTSGLQIDNANPQPKKQLVSC